MRFLTALVMIFIAGLCFAQVPLDFRSEQIYLAPRTLTVRPGGKLMVDGIVRCMAADRIEPYSRYLYLELIGENDSVYVREKLSCNDEGRFSTSMLIDPDIPDGIYYLRSYTRFMRNFSPDRFAQQPIAVGMEIPLPDERNSTGKPLRCIVSANGGNLIAGIPQRLTSVLTSQSGNPVEGCDVILLNNSGDTVATQRTSATGYAIFNFIPEKEKTYGLVVETDSVTMRFCTPPVLSDGLRVNAVLNGAQMRFSIDGTPEMVKEKKLYVYDRINGMSELVVPGRSGLMRFPNSPDGPVTLFLVDSADNVVSENTVIPLVRKKAGLKVKPTVNIGGNVEFSVSGMDTDKYSLISRIVPCNSLWTGDAEEAMVYATDYVSDLPYPRGNGDHMSRYEELSAWFENSRFNKFQISTVLESDSMNYQYFPEFIMGFIGTVFEDSRAKHRLKKGQVLAIDRESGYFYTGDIMDDGRFGLIVPDFEEGTSFSLHTLGEKGDNKETLIVIEDDVFPAVSIRPELKKLEGSQNGHSDMDSIEGKELPEVTVKARVIHEEKKSGKAHYEFKMKDRETIERRGYNTLLDILRDMPLITVAKVASAEHNGSQWHIFGSRGASVLKSERDAGMTLVVDGTKVDADALDVYLGMSAIDIESVEQVSIGEALMIAPNAFDGAISVKTRRTVPQKREKSKGTVITPLGLSDAKLNTFKKLRAPAVAGTYLLIVDVFGPDGITSLKHIVDVGSRK